MTSSRSRLLSTRNLKILLDVARFKLMTTDQVRQLHFEHLNENSDAPRMLMYRCLKAGVVEKYQTHARSMHSTDGLTVTKPKPVWHVSPKCHGTLKRELARHGRVEDYAPFADHCTRFGNRQSVSDQSLPHEIGITSILMALECGASADANIEDLTCIRTSPRHPMTATNVIFHNGAGRTVSRTINPDALVFFRATHAEKRYPFVFFIEYETGTADPQKYLTSKLEPYTAYFEQSRLGGNARPFRTIADQFNREYGLGLNHPERIPFRVLTIARDPVHAHRLLVASRGLSNSKLCLFTSLSKFVANPFDNIWTRTLEFETELEGEYEQLARNRSRPSLIRRWIEEELDGRLTRVSIP